MYKVGVIILLEMKSSYIGTVIKSMWHQLIDKHIDYWNKLDKSETDSHKYAQLIFDQGTKQFNRRWIAFSTNMLEQLDIHGQKINFNLNTLHTDLNIKYKTLKLLEKNRGKQFMNLRLNKSQI